MDFREGFDLQWALMNYAKDKELIAARTNGFAAVERAAEALGWTDYATRAGLLTVED
jgi:hypothetical protein